MAAVGAIVMSAHGHDTAGARLTWFKPGLLDSLMNSPSREQLGLPPIVLCEVIKLTERVAEGYSRSNEVVN